MSAQTVGVSNVSGRIVSWRAPKLRIIGLKVTAA